VADVSEQAWEQGDCYKIEAWWPNITIDPLVEYTRHKDDGIDRVVKLARTGEHTTIHLITPDSLEIIRMWGQLSGLP
jgi:hypothetical protein